MVTKQVGVAIESVQIEPVGGWGSVDTVGIVSLDDAADAADAEYGHCDCFLIAGTMFKGLQREDISRISESSNPEFGGGEC
jgi:hypothetical protein